MVRVRNLVLALALVGCDRLFGVDELRPDAPPTPPDAMVDAAPPPRSCLTETFSGPLDPSLWIPWAQTSATPPEVAITGGVLQVAPHPSTDMALVYSGIETVQTFDLTDGTATVQLVQATTQDMALAVETLFRIRGMDKQRYDFDIAKGSIGVREVTATTMPVNFPVYDPASERWLRLRHSSAMGKVFYDVSETGEPDSWVTIGSNSVIVPVTAVRIGVGAGTYNAVPNPGLAQFDNLTITAPACL